MFDTKNNQPTEDMKMDSINGTDRLGKAFKTIASGAAVLVAIAIGTAGVHTLREVTVCAVSPADESLYARLFTAVDDHGQLLNTEAPLSDATRHELSLKLARELDELADSGLDASPGVRAFSSVTCGKILQFQAQHPERHLTHDPSARAEELKAWSELNGAFGLQQLDAGVRGNSRHPLAM